MKKIHLKIMGLVIICLLTLGAFVGGFSVLALQQLGMKISAHWKPNCGKTLTVWHKVR